MSARSGNDNKLGELANLAWLGLIFPWADGGASADGVKASYIG